MTTSPPVHPSAFRAFEHAGWHGIAAQYPKDFGQLTTWTIEPPRDAVRVAYGLRLLDVATRPGYVAAAAAQRGAKVVAVYFSAVMLADARGRNRAFDFGESDAEALPFPDKNFDAVVINFGLLHLEQPEQAVREAHPVLRSGGRFGLTVWAGPEEGIGHEIVLRAVQANGNLNMPVPPGPPFFRCSDRAACRHVLRAAGFSTPEIVQVPQAWRLRSPEALYEAMDGSTVRMACLLHAQTPEALSAIRTAIVVATSAYQRGDTCELPVPAVLASAVKV